MIVKCVDTMPVVISTHQFRVSLSMLKRFSLDKSPPDNFPGLGAPNYTIFLCSYHTTFDLSRPTTRVSSGCLATLSAHRPLHLNCLDRLIDPF